MRIRTYKDRVEQKIPKLDDETPRIHAYSISCLYLGNYENTDRSEGIRTRTHRVPH